MKPIACLASAALCLTSLACNDHASGTEVVFHAWATGDAGAPARAAGSPVTFTTDLGHTVTLTRALVTLESVEVVPCAPTALERLWRALPNALLATAHAHTPGTPTRLGEPRVLDLLSAAEVELGALNPPPQRYCTVKVALGAADDHASGLPADGTYQGASLLFEGSVDAQGASSPRSFVLRAEAAAVAGPAFTPGELQLSDSERHAQVLLGLPYARWFDGLALATEPDDALATQLLERAAEDVTASVTSPSFEQ